MKGTKFHKKIKKDILSTGVTLRSLSLSMKWHQNRCNCFWNGKHFPSFRYLVQFCMTIHGDDWRNHLIEYAEMIVGGEQ